MNFVRLLQKFHKAYWLSAYSLILVGRITAFVDIHEMSVKIIALFKKFHDKRTLSKILKVWGKY